MVETRFDVVGIGNAIVDVLGHAEDSFLADQGIAKGAMTLIDAHRAERLYSAISPVTESSGGSAANTIAVLACLGGRGAFIGKVAEDALGQVFRKDIAVINVAFDTAGRKGGAATARCIILVTPDAERTMNTYLGACIDLSSDDVPAERIAEAKVTYLEGYLWDPPQAKQAFLKAARVAHEAGRKVALSLSDRFCVERHLDEFRTLVHDHIDILFGNEDEVKALYGTDSFEDALLAARHDCGIVALTRGKQGSVVAAADEVEAVAAIELGGVVDTTGAGDAYAGGFLYGLTHGHSLADCGRIGGVAAAEVISHFGARPVAPLKELVRASVG